MAAVRPDTAGKICGKSKLVTGKTSSHITIIPSFNNTKRDMLPLVILMLLLRFSLAIKRGNISVSVSYFSNYSSTFLKDDFKDYLYGQGIVMSTSGQYIGLNVANDDYFGPAQYFTRAISYDYGQTFSFVEQSFIVISPSGQYIVLGSSDAKVFSTDYGATYSAYVSSHAFAFQGGGITFNDGRYIYFASPVNRYSPVYICHANLAINSTSCELWNRNDGVAMIDADISGTYIFAAAYPTYIVSTDGGLSFTSHAMYDNVRGLAVSGTGQYMALFQLTKLLISTDYGSTFTEKPLPSSTVEYMSGTLSKAANALYAVAIPWGRGEHSQLYVSKDLGDTYHLVDSIYAQFNGVATTYDGELTFVPSNTPLHYALLTFGAKAPTSLPTAKPSPDPTLLPTPLPTLAPSPYPTAAPSSCFLKCVPTAAPSARPTSLPTKKPTLMPTARPSTFPTIAPSFRPSGAPTYKPLAVSMSCGSEAFSSTSINCAKYNGHIVSTSLSCGDGLTILASVDCSTGVVQYSNHTDQY